MELLNSGMLFWTGFICFSPCNVHTHTFLTHAHTTHTYLCTSLRVWSFGSLEEESRLTVSLKWAESFSSKAHSSLHRICRTRYALYSLSFFTEERSLLMLQWNPGQVLKVTDQSTDAASLTRSCQTQHCAPPKSEVCPELGSQEFWAQTFLSKYIWCYPPSYYVGLGWGGLGALYGWNTRSVPSQRVRCWPPSPALCFAYMSSQPMASADTGASHPRWDVAPSMCSPAGVQPQQDPGEPSGWTASANERESETKLGAKSEVYFCTAPLYS